MKYWELLFNFWSGWTAVLYYHAGWTRPNSISGLRGQNILRMVMFTLKNRQQYSIHTDSWQILKEVELNFPSPEANKIRTGL